MKKRKPQGVVVVVGTGAESLIEAARGDYRTLAARVKGDSLGQAERDFLAEHLVKKRDPVRPPNRPPDISKKREVAKLVYLHEILHPEWGREAAVAYTVESYGVSRSYVYAALKSLTLDDLKSSDGKLYVEIWSPASPLSLMHRTSPGK
jgi:hypothetical protein